MSTRKVKRAAPKKKARPRKKPARKSVNKRVNKRVNKNVNERVKTKRESAEARIARAKIVFSSLSRAYPDAHCELDYTNAFELVAATILSAQCTDKRVNMVTPQLFARYPDAHAMARAEPADLEPIIQSTGFFRNKAKSLVGMARAVVEKFDGTVPARMADLVTLPGVGRKTANVVLGNAFGIDEGIVVDTHVARLSARLAFSKATDAVKIESDLIPLFPRTQWTLLSHLLIWHGRRICDARTPRCADCVIAAYCPSAIQLKPARK